MFNFYVNTKTAFNDIYHRWSPTDRKKLRLVKKDIEGKYDKEIKELCPKLSMQITRRFSATQPKEQNKYTILLINATTLMPKTDPTMTIEYSCGSGIDHEPTLTDVLWSITRDEQILEDYKIVDDFLNELGYNDNLESVRTGEEIWSNIVKQSKDFSKLRLPIYKLTELLNDY